MIVFFQKYRLFIMSAISLPLMLFVFSGAGYVAQMTHHPVNEQQ